MSKEAKTESVAHTEERHAKLREESAQNAQAKAAAEEHRKEEEVSRDRRMREEEDQVLTQHANLMQPGESRDQLLERIRKLRDEDQAPEFKPPGLTDYQKQVLEIEQNAGREAVAKAEKEMEASREAREKAAKEQKDREGKMEAVHHPNPGQDQQFPAAKATLGKTK